MRAGCHPQAGLGVSHGILQKLEAQRGEGTCSRTLCQGGGRGARGGAHGSGRGPAGGGWVDTEPGEPSFAEQGRRGEQLTPKPCPPPPPPSYLPQCKREGPWEGAIPGALPPQVSSDQGWKLLSA